MQLANDRQSSVQTSSVRKFDACASDHRVERSAREWNSPFPLDSHGNDMEMETQVCERCECEREYS